MNASKILTSMMVGMAVMASALADDPAEKGEMRPARSAQRMERRQGRGEGRQRPSMRERMNREDAGKPQCLVLVVDTSAAAPKAFQRSIKMAEFAISRIKETDTVAIVTFDNVAETVLPATSGKEKEKILAALHALKPKGEKALMAGLAKGAEEVRKASEGQVKRMMLLSTPAPVTIGPGAPEDLRQLSESLRKEGIRFNGGMHMMGPMGGFGNGSHRSFGHPGPNGEMRPGRGEQRGEGRGLRRQGREGRRGRGPAMRDGAARPKEGGDQPKAE